MNIEQNKVLNKAIEKYGLNQQVDKAVEELAELVVAIQKIRNKPYTKELRNNLIEELADVETMIWQLKRIFIIKESELNEIKAYKIERLQQRLNDL